MVALLEETEPREPVERARDLMAAARRIAVLTGAGCSTESGIPDYRNVDGGWKHRRPTTYQQFVGRESVRRRYWAGSFVGWSRIAGAEPNGAHDAIVTGERRGRLAGIVTQNVDGLHQRAGSGNVVDLHGRLDRVVCMACRVRFPRAPFQEELRRLNPGWEEGGAVVRPDGDAAIPVESLKRFRVPCCPFCGGTLKPDVVFFGEVVPPARVRRAFGIVDEADALLVVGSSLMVWSGYRFVVHARERGVPVVLVNLGRTRADGEVTVKIEAPCGTVLDDLLRPGPRKPEPPTNNQELRTND